MLFKMRSYPLEEEKTTGWNPDNLGGNVSLRAASNQKYWKHLNVVVVPPDPFLSQTLLKYLSTVLQILTSSDHQLW